MHLKGIFLTSLLVLEAHSLVPAPLTSRNPTAAEAVFNPISCKDACPYSKRITNNRKHMRKLWNKLEVDGWFEIWRKALPYKNWSKHLAKNIWPKLAPNIDCTSMEGTCKPLSDDCGRFAFFMT
jgi:hypothetical protein